MYMYGYVTLRESPFHFKALFAPKINDLKTIS